MAFLIKRKDYWHIVWYEHKLINGVICNIRKAKTTRCKSKSDANKKLTEFSNKDHVNGKRILLSEYMIKYLLSGLRKPKHLKNIKNRFNEFIKFAGDRFLDQYETEDVDMFLNSLSPKLSLYTVKGYRSDLHAGFQQALKWKYVRENIVFYSNPIKVPEPEILFFSKPEFNLFINSIKDETFKDIAVFTLFTGLRAGDIVNIKLSDIFLELKYIRIMATNLHNPKNQKTNWTEIADELFPMLEKYIKTNKIYLFESNKFKRKFSVHYICNKFKLLVQSSPINHRHSHKSLRKTFASWLLEETNDFSKVYPHLHHSSPRVGLKHYAKLIHPVYTGLTNLINYKK